MTATLPTVLTDAQSQVWRDERRELESLLTVLGRWDATADDLAVLRQALTQLDELFLLVVAGEFNSGKSALINALLGERYLTEGVTPTTAQIHLLRHGDKGSAAPERGVLVMTYPSPFLREINVVDTPGTNAVLREHEAITRDFVPRSDLVLFVTSADRPFTESERAFLSAIRDWGKKIVIIVNKIDILETRAEQEQVLTFVRDNARQLLGALPDIFPLSARLALRAKVNAQAEAANAPGGGAQDGAVPAVPTVPAVVAALQADPWWAASQFEPFERYIFETLNQESRIRLKLLNPLGVGAKLAADYQGRMAARRGLLQEDLRTLDVVEQELGLYHQDMQTEFDRRFDRIDNLILQMRVRGEEFFDDRIKLRRVFELLNTQQLADDFEASVVADTPQRVEAEVEGMIDWMVERELKEWKVIASELDRRQQTEFLSNAARETAGGFEYNRRHLIDSVGRAAGAVVARYDREVESQTLVEGVQDALTQTALAGVGAVSLGVVLHAVLVGAAADATGILAAGVVGALGLAILPYKRSQAKNDLRAKTDELRARLRETLEQEFNQQLENSIDRLREAIGPYSRFVRAEHERLLGLQSELDAVAETLGHLRARIDRVLPEPARV